MISKGQALQWTTIVMSALADAKRNPDKLITIQVGRPESAAVIEEAIMALMGQGNLDALRIQVEIETLH
mgnify:FL=1|tara:strand:+ start:211 stop:417 length:207 start_codon:yes stop_codon:yes gene_type:complete